MKQVLFSFMSESIRLNMYVRGYSIDRSRLQSSDDHLGTARPKVEIDRSQKKTFNDNESLSWQFLSVSQCSEW